MTVETDALTGTDTLIEITSVEDGSYLDGYVNVAFLGESARVFANATAEEVRAELEAIGTGSLSVSRKGTLLHALFEKTSAVVSRQGAV